MHEYILFTTHAHGTEYLWSPRGTVHTYILVYLGVLFVHGFGFGWVLSFFFFFCLVASIWVFFFL